MQVKVKVQAQYFENYSQSSSPIWKPKGGQEFIFPVDSDWVMYVTGSQLLESIKKMLADYSNAHWKYEFLDYDVQFHEPIVLEGLQEMNDKLVELKK